MFVCTVVLYICMKLLRNYVLNLSDNMHMRSKIYHIYVCMHCGPVYLHEITQELCP